MNIKALLSGLPEIIQYVVILGLIMVILYVCLKLTKLLGEKHGEKQTFDTPEAYDETVPDIFASTFLKKKNASNKNSDKDTEA